MEAGTSRHAGPLLWSLVTSGCERVDKGPVHCLSSDPVCFCWFLFPGRRVVFFSDVFFSSFKPAWDRKKKLMSLFPFTDHSNTSILSRFNKMYLPFPWRFSHVDASPPPAEGLGADVGGDEVAVAHSPRPAEEVRQTMSNASCRVAGSLLCCNAASGEQTRG